MDSKPTFEKHCLHSPTKCDFSLALSQVKERTLEYCIQYKHKLVSSGTTNRHSGLNFVCRIQYVTYSAVRGL